MVFSKLADISTNIALTYFCTACHDSKHRECSLFLLIGFGYFITKEFLECEMGCRNIVKLVYFDAFERGILRLHQSEIP